MTSLFDSISSQRKLVALSETPGVTIPTYVAQYTPLSKEAASKLPEELFADVNQKEYPIDTKEAAWLSAGIFLMEKQSGELTYSDDMEEYVWNALKASGDIYGIEDDIVAIKTAVDSAVNEKTAAVDSDGDYGWLVKSADGSVTCKRYPMFDAVGVMKAATYFMDNRSSYPQCVRTEICGNIMRKAAEYSVDINEINDAISREAGLAVPNTAAIMRELYKRAQASKDPEAGMAMLGLTELISITDADQLSGEMSKLAGIVEDFDHVEGLNAAYDRKVAFPADILYAGTVKQAEDWLRDTVNVAGTSFSKSALASLDIVLAYDPILGTEFTKRASVDGELDKEKLAVALTELDEADQYALVRHLQHIRG